MRPRRLHRPNGRLGIDRVWHCDCTAGRIGTHDALLCATISQRACDRVRWLWTGVHSWLSYPLQNASLSLQHR